MKIIGVKTIKSYIYELDIKYNWLERLFGSKSGKYKFKETDSIFTFGGGHVYIDEEGEKLTNFDKRGEYMDRWKRKLNF